MPVIWTADYIAMLHNRGLIDSLDRLSSLMEKAEEYIDERGLTGWEERVLSPMHAFYLPAGFLTCELVSKKDVLGVRCGVVMKDAAFKEKVGPLLDSIGKTETDVSVAKELLKVM